MVVEEGEKESYEKIVTGNGVFVNEN